MAQRPHDRVQQGSETGGGTLMNGTVWRTPRQGTPTAGRGMGPRFMAAATVVLTASLLGAHRAAPTRKPPQARNRRHWPRRWPRRGKQYGPTALTARPEVASAPSTGNTSTGRVRSSAPGKSSRPPACRSTSTSTGMATSTSSPWRAAHPGPPAGYRSPKLGSKLPPAVRWSSAPRSGSPIPPTRWATGPVSGSWGRGMARHRRDRHPWGRRRLQPRLPAATASIP